MKITQEFNRNFGKWFLNDVLKAIQTYSLIKSGDRVCVALSGGKDSTTLLYILHYLNRFSNLDFDLSAIHIKIGGYATIVMEQVCDTLKVPYFEESVDWAGKPDNCYICSRLKRGAISARLQNEGIKLIAYGHHANDIAETFFMNIVLNKKLGSFSPKVALGGETVTMIRPMIYLEEPTIRKIHTHLNLPVLDWQCPFSENNQRFIFKQALSQMNHLFHTSGFIRKVVESLENIDNTNLWADLTAQQ